MGIAFDEPMDLLHVIDFDENRRIVGYLVGKQHAMAESQFRREQREFDELCQRIVSGSPLTRELELCRRILESPPITKKKKIRPSRRTGKRPRYSCPGKYGKKGVPLELQCEARMVMRPQKCRDKFVTMRSGRRVCYIHFHAEKVSW